MGIRTSTDDTTSGLEAFSDHMLKIEITGPNQEHFTVIDVPGIFRVPSPPITTDSDVAKVRDMVISRMHNKRTIILAVLPSNVDISTQEVLKMAEEADPEGSRTMGVLTKPDLMTEKATQETINDLLLGKRNKLRLGFFVVKNRGADDERSTTSERIAEERTFFEKAVWTQVKKTGRCGIPALEARLRDLLRAISKTEFPHVKSDITKFLRERRDELGSIGPSRQNASS
ncbi:hypothetical protein BU23DRAFT_257595 [Bimuria novae-zelandiae CBS 107.79]|uniref:Dynamin-type G domain-containing protein n=1 Tax=Bimuria novae-zelandiae CBS 107.79 TaxID=1447943 RepID=A0A6A5UVD4_9PLEO|nr:hypothetical protein BU23DRAFT_257595 [Bimuria novae-zelandiae CBS 107.79]